MEIDNEMDESIMLKNKLKNENQQVARYTLRQDSKFFMQWNIILMINGVYSAIAYPYYMVNEIPGFKDPGILIIFLSEFLFLVDIILSFFKQEINEDGQSKAEPLEIIAYKYFKNGFIYDLITFLPLGLLSLTNDKLYFLWSIKALRIRQLNIQMSDKVLMPIITSLIERYQKKALNDPQKRNDIIMDHIYIKKKIYIFSGVKLLRLIFKIVFIAYLYGQLWYVFSKTIYLDKIDLTSIDTIKTFNQQKNSQQSFDQQSFVNNYGNWNILIQSNSHRVILNTYFAFTTLTSVGFGDFYPVSEIERACFVLIFLFGVALFSYFIGLLINIVIQILSIGNEQDDKDKLEMFFVTLKKYNHGIPIKQDLQKEILDFMNFKWQNNRNNFLNHPKDVQIFNDLPQEIQQKIYTDFIFRDFLNKFNRFFSFKEESLKINKVEIQQNQNLVVSEAIKKFKKKVHQIIQANKSKKEKEGFKIKKLTKEEILQHIEYCRKRVAEWEKNKQKELKLRKQKFKKFQYLSYGLKNEKIKYPFLTWHDKRYSQFMTSIMENLQIRKYCKGSIIMKELDECNEVLFVIDGRYNIGYEVNKKVRYRKQFGASTLIGGFQMCYKKRFIFVYKVHSELKGYALRRKEWYKIMKSFPDFHKIIKQKTLRHYFDNIYRPLMKQKNIDINDYEERNDYFQVLATQDQHYQEMRECMKKNSDDFEKEYMQRIEFIVNQQKIIWLLQTIEKKFNIIVNHAFNIYNEVLFVKCVFWNAFIQKISQNFNQDTLKTIKQLNNIMNNQKGSKMNEYQYVNVEQLKLQKMVTKLYQELQKNKPTQSSLFTLIMLMIFRENLKQNTQIINENGQVQSFLKQKNQKPNKIYQANDNKIELKNDYNDNNPNVKKVFQLKNRKNQQNKVNKSVFKSLNNLKHKKLSTNDYFDQQQQKALISEKNQMHGQRCLTGNKVSLSNSDSQAPNFSNQKSEFIQKSLLLDQSSEVLLKKQDESLDNYQDYQINKKNKPQAISISQNQLMPSIVIQAKNNQLQLNKVYIQDKQRSNQMKIQSKFDQNAIIHISKSNFMQEQQNENKQVMCQLSIQVEEKDDSELSNAIKEIQNAKKKSITLKSTNKSPTTSEFIQKDPFGNQFIEAQNKLFNRDKKVIKPPQTPQVNSNLNRLQRKSINSQESGFKFKSLQYNGSVEESKIEQSDNNKMIDQQNMFLTNENSNIHQNQNTIINQEDYNEMAIIQNNDYENVERVQIILGGIINGEQIIEITNDDIEKEY